MKEVEPDTQFEPDETQAAVSLEDIHEQIIAGNILQARVYDVLLTLLLETNEEKAEQLLELHRKGGLFSPAPSYDPSRQI